MTKPQTHPFLLQFATDDVISISTPDDSEKMLPNIIFLTTKEQLDFMSAESTYWAWQTKFKMQYRTRVRATLEQETSTI